MNVLLDVVLQNKGVGFLEYSILAILCAALYGLSSLEWMYLRSESSSDFDEMRKASQFAIAGVFVSIIVGIVAELDILPGLVETSLLALPLILMGEWLTWHQVNSKIVRNFDAIRPTVQRKLTGAVWEVLREDPKRIFSKEDLLAECQNHSPLSRLTSAISKGVRDLPVFGRVAGILEIFVFNAEKLDDVLKALEKADRVEILANDFVQLRGTGSGKQEFKI